MISRPLKPIEVVEAEKALCIGVICEPWTLDHIAESVEPSDFSEPNWGKLYGELRTMHAAGDQIGDMVLLAPVIRRCGMEPLGEFAQALNLGERGNQKYYAAQIRNAAMLRSLQLLAIQILDRVHDSRADYHSVCEIISATLGSLGHRNPTQTKRAYDVAVQLLDAIERDRREEMARGVPTGLDTVDSQFGRFMPGELTLLAARTSVGKTSLATQFACCAADRKVNSLIVSLEMRDEEVISRIIASDAKVDGRAIRCRSISDFQMQSLRSAAAALEPTPLWICAPPAATVEQISAIARMEHARRGLGFLVVDYVGRIRPTDPRRERHEQVSHISGSLKTIAVSLNIPVLALVQLNRDADGKTPMLSQLRDSGSLEQDADVVFLLHRPSLGSTDAHLIVAKHRHGTTGSVPLKFSGSSTTYSEAKAERNGEFDSWNKGEF